MQTVRYLYIHLKAINYFKTGQEMKVNEMG